MQSEPGLARVLSIGAWCNNAEVTPRPDGSGMWQVVGDPTEGALIVAAMKAGIEAGGLEKGHHVLYEIPFDSERRAMSVVVGEDMGGATMYTKGAPEVVLSRCVTEWRDGRVEPLDEARRADDPARRGRDGRTRLASAGHGLPRAGGW